MLPNEIRARSVQFLHQQAEIYFNQGQFEDALKACNQLLQIQSDYAPGCKLMADILLRQGKLQEAQQWYTRTLQVQPNWAEVHANLGSLYAKAQQWQQAIACYEKAVTLKPNFAGAYRNLARVWTQLNEPKKSAQALYQALTLEPNQASAEEYFNLGHQLAQHGDVKAAETCYRTAIQLNPNLTAAHQSLGTLLQGQGKAQEATQVYRQAIQLNTPQAPSDTLAAATARTTVAVEPSPQDTLAGALQQPRVKNGTTPPINHPSNPQTYLKQAQAYCSLKEWDQAIAACQKALRLKPDLAEAYKIQGNALQILGEMSAAVRCYSKALEIQPQYPEVYANLGSLYAQEERLEKAASYYQQAVNLKPDFAGVYRNFAKVLTKMGQLEQASQCLEKAYSLEPEKATPEEHFNLGNTRFKQGRLEEAIAAYQQALKLNPQLAGAYYQLGQLYSTKAELDAAIQAYQRALELEPSRLEFYYGFADFFSRQERWDDAIRIYNQILGLDANQAVAYYKVGEIFNRQWRLEEAVNLYQKSIALNPKLVSSYYGLGKVLVKQENWQDAVQVLRQGIQMNPSGDAEAYKGFGDALAKIGEREEAIKAYQKSAELDSNNAEVYQKLGDLLRDQEQFEEAITAYHRSIEIDPNVFWTQNNLADIFFKQERWEEAISAYQNAITVDSSYSWSYNSLADAFFKLERWEEAIPAYEQAIKLNPQFPWSHYNLGEVLTQLEYWEKAVVAYRGAIKVQSDLPNIQEKLADALRNRAKLDLQESLGYYYQVIQEQPDHVAAYHKAIEIKPDDPQLYIQLANTLVNHDHLDGAIVFYQMALQLEPEHPEVLQKLEGIVEKKKARLTPYFSVSQSQSEYEQLYQAWLKYNSIRSEAFTPQSPEGLTTSSEAFTPQSPEGLTTKDFQYQPLISIIMPVYNTPEIFLREAIQSVLDQVYTNWELCIADDASTAYHVKPILEEYQQQDSRIKVIFRTKNGHISATSNSALELATGEFIGLLDHDDVLTADALYEVVSLLNQHPSADMIYSDEDKLNENGELTGHFFKPDWCPDSFLSRMYTCHFGVYRRQIIKEIGGFRTGYEGSQDYDLVLRFTEKTDQIFHIPKILYHWRIHSSSAAGGTEAKPYAYEAAKRALQDAIDRRGEPGIVKDVPIYLGHYLVRYKILDYKRVSIIIPTKDLGEILNRCLESIFTLSIYPNYEVIVIDNGSIEAQTQEILAKWQAKEPTRFRYYALDIPFNFSKINNYAVSQATGDYLLFLNNDTEVIHPDWIDGMVEQAQRSSIGAVGALLRYPDKIVQHAGVVIGIGHFAAHSHRLASETDPGYYGQIISISNYSAVTAACLMCRREVFEQVGGFDEQLAVAYNDVDFCLKLVEQGYRNIYLPHVVLYHYESKSRGYDTTPDKLQRFMQEVIITRQRWQHYVEHDPCYNPNLTLCASDYSLRRFAEVEIFDVLIEFDDRVLQNCAIDEPEIKTYWGISQITFKGWVLGKQEKITAVQIIGNHGQVIKEIPANFTRLDVRLLHPENPNSEFCGFCETIELRNLSEQTELLFQAILNNGTYAKFGQIKLKINP